MSRSKRSSVIAGNGVVPVAPLLVERERPTFRGAGLEGSVEATALACSAEQDEEGVRERGEEEQSITTARRADVRGRQAHSEVHVLGIAEGLLDGKLTAVQLGHCGGAEVDAARCETPRVLIRLSWTRTTAGTGLLSSVTPTLLSIFARPVFSSHWEADLVAPLTSVTRMQSRKRMT